MNRTFRRTLPRFSSSPKPCGYLEGPGGSPELLLLLRSRRASWIRFCFQPLNGTVCGALSVFMCAGSVCVSASPPRSFKWGVFMEMSCANAPRAFSVFFFWRVLRHTLHIYGNKWLLLEENRKGFFYSSNRCVELKQECKCGGTCTEISGSRKK